MFQEFFKKLIVYILGKIVHNFPANEIVVSKWTGIVQKKNLIIKEEFIEYLGCELGLPLILKRGVIGSLYIKVPWNKIWKEPCTIIIEDVIIVCETTDSFDENFAEKRAEAKKQEYLEELFSKQGIKRQSTIRENGDSSKGIQENGDQTHNKGSGYSSRLNLAQQMKELQNVIRKNIRFEIKNFHLRFEDEGIINQGKKFSLGILFKSLEIQPSNSIFNKNHFVENKNEEDEKAYHLFELNNFSLYYESFNKAETWGKSEEFKAMDDSVFLERSKVRLAQRLAAEDTVFIINPFDLRVEKSTNNAENDVNLVNAHKSTRILIENFDITVDNEQQLILVNLKKLINWHCMEGEYLKLRPPYHIRPNIDPVRWWKYANESVTRRIKRRKEGFEIDNMTKKKVRRNEYINMYQLKLLHDAEENDFATTSKKMKILQENSLVFEVEGETVEKSYSDLLLLLQEYEKVFSIDEIVAYRRHSLHLIKDSANIKQLLRRQTKPKPVTTPRKIVDLFKKMKRRITFDKSNSDLKGKEEDPNHVEFVEEDIHFIKEFIEENSKTSTKTLTKNENYLKSKITMNINRFSASLKIQAPKLNSYIFLKITLGPIFLENLAFQHSSNIFFSIEEVMVVDSLTTIPLFEYVLMPKKVSFLRRYQKNFPGSLKLIRDSAKIVEKSEFLRLRLLKSNEEVSSHIGIDLHIEPFEIVVNNEILTRLKFFFETSEKKNTSMEEIFTDVLANKEDIEKFLKKKLKQLFGHSLSLSINIDSEDSFLIIPENINRENTSLLFFSYQNFKIYTGGVNQSFPLLENHSMALDNSDYFEDEPAENDKNVWDIFIDLQGLNCVYLNPGDFILMQNNHEIELLEPFSISLNFQRKFFEKETELFTEIISKLVFTEVKLNLPLMRSVSFKNILTAIDNVLSVMKSFKRKSPVSAMETQTSQVKKKKPKKSFFSLTVSRKSSAHFTSSRAGEDDEFYDAYEDLNDLLQANQEPQALTGVKETVEKENLILNQKAEKLKGYLMQNEIMLVKLRSYISFDISVTLPEISIRLYESMVQTKFIGSSLVVKDFVSTFVSDLEKREINTNISFGAIKLCTHKLEKLIPIIETFTKKRSKFLPDDIELIKEAQPIQPQANPRMTIFKDYKFNLALKIQIVEGLIMDARKHIKDMVPLFSLRVNDLSFGSTKPIKINGEEADDNFSERKIGLNAKFKSRLEIFIDYLNQKNNKFEPFIERLELELLASLKAPNTKKITLNFKNQFLINISPFVLENFVILQTWIKNLARIEEASKQAPSSSIENKKPFNYYISNKVGLLLRFWTAEDAGELVGFNEKKEIKLTSIKKSSLNVNNEKLVFAEYNINDGVDSFKSSKRFIKIQLDNHAPVYEIDIDDLQDKTFDFEGKINIIFSFSLKDDEKILTIQSNIYIQNNLKINVLFKVYDSTYSLLDQKKNYNFYESMLDVNRNEPLPLFITKFEYVKIRPDEGLEEFGFDWSDSGNLRTILNEERPLFLRSRNTNSHSFQDFIYTTVNIIKKKKFKFYHQEKNGEKINQSKNCHIYKISFNPPISIENYLPVAMGMKIFQNSQTIHRTSSFMNANWIFEETSSMKIRTPAKSGDISFNSSMSLEEPVFCQDIKPGLCVTSNNVNINNVFGISVTVEDYSWSNTFYIQDPPNRLFEKRTKTEELEDDMDSRLFDDSIHLQKSLQKTKEQKKFVYFQLVSSSRDQLNIILESAQENGIYKLLFFTEYWILNETPSIILYQIKENKFFYEGARLTPVHKMQTDLMTKRNFSLETNKGLGGQAPHNKPERSTSTLQAINIKEGLESILNKKKEEEAAEKNYLNAETFEKSYFSLSSSYFSKIDVEGLISQKAKEIKMFSGAIENKKKIFFKIDKVSSWSIPINLSDNKSLSFIKLSETQAKKGEPERTFIFNLQTIRLPGEFRRTHLLLISPRHILINKTKYFLEFKQSYNSLKEQYFSLDPKNVKSLLTVNEELMSKVSMRLAKNDYVWSRGFSLEEVGNYAMRIVNITNTENIIIIINITMFSSIFVITFDESHQKPPFLLENFTLHNFKIHQESSEETAEILQSSKSIAFAWDDPFNEKKLIIKILDSSRKFIKIASLELETIKNVRLQYEIQSSVSFKNSEKILIDIYVEDDIKRVKIHHDLHLATKDVFKPLEQTAKNFLKLSLNIPDFGLSFINSTPREIAYLSLQNFRTKISKTTEVFDLVFVLESFQIDNHATKPGSEVFFAVPQVEHKKKKKFYSEMEPSLGESVKFNIEKIKNYLKNKQPPPTETYKPTYEPFVSCKLSVEKKSVSVSYLKSMKLKMLPYEINFEGTLMQALVDLYGSFSDLVMKHFGTLSDFLEKENFLMADFYDSEIVQQTRKESISSNHESQINLIIEKFFISPIQFECRFKNMHFLNESFSHIYGFKIITMLLNTIGSHNFSLQRKFIRNHKISIESLIHQLNSGYIMEMRNQMLNIVGSAGMIGNPNKFFQQISLGIYDFLSQISDRANTQRATFYYGLIKSTRSFGKTLVLAMTESMNSVLETFQRSLFNQICENSGTPTKQSKNQKEKVLVDSIFPVKQIPEDQPGGLKGAFGSLTSSFTKFIQTTMLWPFSQSYFPLILKKKKQTSKKLENSQIDSANVQPKRLQRYISRKLRVIEPFSEEKSIGKLVLSMIENIDKEAFESFFIFKLNERIFLILISSRLILFERASFKLTVNLTFDKIISFKANESRNLLILKFMESSTANGRHSVEDTRDADFASQNQFLKIRTHDERLAYPELSEIIFKVYNDMRSLRNQRISIVTVFNLE